MSAKEEEKPEGAEGEAKPKSKKKLFIIIGVVLLLAGGGVPFLLGGKKDDKKADAEEEHVEEVKVYETAKLDTFIVNLSENSTFLKTTILLEYDSHAFVAKTGDKGGEAEGGGHGGGGEAPKSGALPAPLEKRKPMINDAVIRVLSSKRSTDVLTSDGKEQLKQELIEAINEAIGMEEAPVVNIYFTEFIVQ